jgi:hypothetical protein
MKSPPVPLLFDAVVLAILLAVVPATDAANTKPAATQSSQKPKPRPERFCYYNPVRAAVFALGADVSIQVGTNANATLRDLKVGKVARIGYTVVNGEFIAHSIVVSESAGKNTPQRYASGPITAINSSAGTITIKYRP